MRRFFTMDPDFRLDDNCVCGGEWWCELPSKSRVLQTLVQTAKAGSHLCIQRDTHSLTLCAVVLAPGLSSFSIWSMSIFEWNNTDTGLSLGGVGSGTAGGVTHQNLLRSSISAKQRDTHFVAPLAESPQSGCPFVVR